jgi:hypothetical protein
MRKWILINIYGPCQSERKASFLEWFSNIDMPNDADWLIMEDLTSSENLQIETCQEEISMT